MIFNGVDLLRRVVKPGSLGALVADGSGFLVFKWALRTVIFGVDLKHFALFGRVPGAMQHACLFCTGWCIAWMAYIIFLVISSAALFEVIW